MRTTTMQRNTKNFFLLPSAKIRCQLEKDTNTIIYNMGGRVESDLLCTDQTITYVKKERKKKVDCLKEH